MASVIKRTKEQAVVTSGDRRIPSVEAKGRQGAFTIEGKRNIDTVDIRTDSGMITVQIPAIHRTNFWAILKYMYQKHSRKVYEDEFCAGVRLMMLEADAPKWDKFIGKKHVPAVVNGEGVRLAPKSWKSRLITNGRNLCRIGKNSSNVYGKRLIDRGHVMRYETDIDGRGYFIMHLKLTATNIAQRKRGRKPKPI